MPPRRQPSARSTVSETKVKSTTTSTRNVTRKASSSIPQSVPEADDGTTDLAKEFDEKLMIQDVKGKRKASSSNVVARSTRSHPIREESTSLPQSKKPDIKGKQKPIARLVLSRKTVDKSKASDRSNSLATELEDKLTLTDENKKRITSSKTTEQVCLEAMRTVNLASRELSSAVNLGWKASSEPAPAPTRKKTTGAAHTVSSLHEHSTTARRALQELREMKPLDVDIERAAGSLVSKLITLELYDCAMGTLEEMQGHLSTLYTPVPTQLGSSSISSKAGLLSLPLPSVTDTSDDILTLLSTYLLHSLTAVSYITFSTTLESGLEDLFTALYTTDTLLRWLPHLKTLPTKHCDSILTRAYTSLTKSSSLTQPSSSEVATWIYRIRAYGLLCLAHTSQGVLEPSTFWSQAAKFAVSYVKDTDLSNAEAADPETASHIITTVSTTFSELIQCAQSREDRSAFMSGRGFIAFCEYWTSFAKRSNDLPSLELIRGLIQSNVSPTPSKQSPVKASMPTDTETNTAIEPARLYALFTQATVLLEQAESVEGLKCLEEVIEAMDRCPRYLELSYATITEADTHDEDRRNADKVKRSFERVRRAAAKILETSTPSIHRSSQASWRPLVKTVIEKGVDILEIVINIHPHHDLLTAALDSLFLLARISLVPANSSTYTEAYDYLARSSSLIPKDSSGADLLPHANFVRCISGAYHNLAAILYQTTRFDFAVRFLDQSCALGEKALVMYRAVRKADEVTDVEDDKIDESWAQLEDQLHRRWEILGVCHSKTGDRKLAFTSFVNCIRTFPFHRYDFVQLAAKSSPSLLFQSPKLKHIADITDRLTYVGLCDLYLDPHAVSLKTHLKESFGFHSDAESTHDAIAGALLERQIESLEGSRWKPAIRTAVDKFLGDLLEVYKPSQMPLRRARALLKCLEMVYHTQDGSEPDVPDNINTGETAVEADILLTKEDVKHDEPLAHHRLLYRATLNLRLALLVHRSAQTSQFSRVVTYAEEACSILKRLTSEQRQPAANDSPTQARGSKKTAAKTPGGANRVAIGRSRARVVKTAATAAPVTPKRKSSKSVPAQATAAAVTVPKLESTAQVSEFDGMPQLVDLLRTTAQLLGLLGQVVTKVRLLLQARRICERLVETHPDDFVKISVDLAHEYVKLGKSEKGANIYRHTLSAVKNLSLSEETRVLYFLRYSESLAITGNVLKSSTVYCEAHNLSEGLSDTDKGMPTLQRVTARSASLERAAIAASTFAFIQYSRDEPATSINGLLQSLRLWNRALDTLSRLVPPKPAVSTLQEADNPFLSDETKTTATSQTTERSEAPLPRKMFKKPPALNGLEWRIAEGLLSTLFSLIQAYVARGSPREAEYFAQQAKDLAESLDAPAMASRAFARIGEIQLHLGQLEDSHTSLTKAAELAANIAGPDTAEIRRLQAEHSRLNADGKEAHQLYEEAISMLEELDDLFVTLDGASAGPRKSLSTSPKTQAMNETLSPDLLVSILRQNIWLLHGEGEEYQTLLERLRSIPATAEAKAEQNALMGKLTLDHVYSRFQADMFLSSLTESTITLPMGKAWELATIPASTQEILAVLANAEKLFWSDLALIARRGKVFHVRDAAISLALIRAFQVSLGKISAEGPVLAASLLDSSTAITLRREILEAVQHKFPDVETHDDLQWPLITSNGSPLPPQKPRNRLRFTSTDSDSSDDDVFEEKPMKAYWAHIKEKYEAYVCDAAHLSKPQANDLPSNWTVISISVTEDKNTMFVTRQRPNKEPLIVCIPLKGRRESDDADVEQMTFDDAVNELKEIIQLSDDGTRQAFNVRNDREARAGWWADRTALDKRLKELLENIEFCWLGAFKSILSPPVTVPQDLLEEFRASIEHVFERSIVLRDKRNKTSVCLDDSLVECFASLSPKCRDEELEDIIYFILDLYQFHGIPVASAEVDIDQAVVDVRSALEEFSAKSQGRLIPEEDPHMFLILDKNVQGIPWESIPILRGRSISRIPSMDFLLDRLDYIKWQKESAAAEDRTNGIAVDPHKVFYVLNPSGDLKNTEGRFVDWLKDMKKVGWEGVTGRPPSEQQFADALTRKDLVLYFGHGGAEQYIRSHKVRHLSRCAATMLWGCSSGALKEMGDFDRTGTPHNYMLAGCPTLVANLWDVTDRDIDKFAQSVFNKMGLNAEQVRHWNAGSSVAGTSVVAALGQSRDACKLKYLTGAAPVIYGIPFYL